VPSYSSFLPYCHRSEITKWSSPDAEYGRRWPSEGILTSGFGGITESFVSRVYCVPGRYVESVGGDTNTSLRPDMIAHHLEGGEKQSGRTEGENGLLTHLRSKWTIEAMRDGETQVSLAVEFAFSNPMYAALSGGVAPKVAEFMIRAFEKRVKEVLERNPEMVRKGLGQLEGSGLKK
jgi:coenzyme Q-binding protein COQ10